jgi:hypothetical protein
MNHCGQVVTAAIVVLGLFGAFPGRRSIPGRDRALLLALAPSTALVAWLLVAFARGNARPQEKTNAPFNLKLTTLAFAIYCKIL